MYGDLYHVLGDHGGGHLGLEAAAKREELRPEERHLVEPEERGEMSVCTHDSQHRFKKIFPHLAREMGVVTSCQSLL